MTKIQDEYDLAKYLCAEKGLDGAIKWLKFLLRIPETKIYTYAFIQDTLNILEEIKYDEDNRGESKRRL